MSRFLGSVRKRRGRLGKLLLFQLSKHSDANQDKFAMPWTHQVPVKGTKRVPKALWDVALGDENDAAVVFAAVAARVGDERAAATDQRDALGVLGHLRKHDGVH